VANGMNREKRLMSEAVNGGVLQINCSAAAASQEA